jgi:Sigma-70 region 2
MGRLEQPDKLGHFEKAVLPHFSAAYNLAGWLARNDHDAEDLVQEACMRALKSFDGFRGVDARAWLLAIVRNRCCGFTKTVCRSSPPPSRKRSTRRKSAPGVRRPCCSGVQTPAESKTRWNSYRRVSRGNRLARTGGYVVQRDYRTLRHTGGYRHVPSGQSQPTP